MVSAETTNPTTTIAKLYLNRIPKPNGKTDQRIPTQTTAGSRILRQANHPIAKECRGKRRGHRMRQVAMALPGDLRDGEHAERRHRCQSKAAGGLANRFKYEPIGQPDEDILQ